MIGASLAVVPLRGAGKTRLRSGEGPGLDERERAVLASAMLSDVLAALRAAPVDNVVVAAADATAAAVAGALGIDVVRDPPRADLDAALHAAVTAVACGTAIVITADLPCLTPDDVAALLEREAQVVVGPTADGGTSALLRRPPTVIPTAYGSGSAGRHLELAQEAGLTTAVVDRPGFRVDVDTWEDLLAIRSAPVGRATAAFLERLGPRLRTAP